jgi:voltage-gated potassium channel
VPSDLAADAQSRRLRPLLQALYHGQSLTALRFRTAWVLIDLAIIGFFLAAPLIRNEPWFLAADYAIAALLALDLLARAAAYPRGGRAFFSRPMTWLDLLILGTLLYPSAGYNLGFLRALRIWTLVNSEVFWDTVGRRFDETRVEEVTRAAAALLTFVFVTTGFVYTAFAGREGGPEGWVDSLYFTITSLTTTGYGDITLPGIAGKLLSILIMVSGITLFVRLAQAMFRPHKVRFRCPRCALLRHEPDAVHCKACGVVLDIPNDEH